MVHVSNATRVPFQVLATVLNGEHYLTGEEVCERLCISKRTLQDYRDTGLLGYVQLPGKIIYRESDIMDLLERFYQK